MGVEELIYDPDRDGPLPTAEELAQLREAEDEVLIRQPGIRVRVKALRTIERCFRQKRGEVVSVERAADVAYPLSSPQTIVILVRLDGQQVTNWFWPEELAVVR